MPMEVEKTWDDARLKRDRLVLLQEQMRKGSIGAMYLTDTNLRYVLNMKIPGGQVFVPVEGEPIAFVQARDIRFVRSQHVNTRPRLQDGRSRSDGDDRSENYRPLGQGIAALITEHGVAGGLLGVDTLEIAAVLALQEAGVRLVDGGPLVEQAGSVKTQDEVAIYRTIAQQYEHALRAFRDAIRSGISENELAGVVQGAWYEAGGEDISQINVCSGPNMNPWRRWPTQRRLSDGEFVGIDLHARGANGLRGDVSRTYLVGGDPTSEQRDLYRRAYDYMQETVSAIRAGHTYGDVLDAMPKVPAEFRVLLDSYAIFHGVGMSYAESPRVDHKTSKLDAVLRPNQVLSVESYFGEEGSPLAVKLEQQILVQEDGPEVLGSGIPFDERFVG